MRMRPSSLRRSGRPCSDFPYAESFVTCPPKDAVEAWPPVFEYTCVSRTSTLMSAPDATMRDSDWKPMSYIAPSPPITQMRRSPFPPWSQRARMPSASAGPFSKSEFVHGTRYGLYGYVLPKTEVQPG